MVPSGASGRGGTGRPEHRLGGRRTTQVLPRRAGGVEVVQARVENEEVPVGPRRQVPVGPEGSRDVDSLYHTVSDVRRPLKVTYVNISKCEITVYKNSEKKGIFYFMHK